MPRGLFITLEGLDGSGKTTQLKRLAGWMQKRGMTPLITRQPGGTPTGDRIRELLLDSRSQGLAPLAEMALMFADRAQAIAEVIEPALAAGQIVLCDRFTDSTEAYQGGGRELGSAVVLECGDGWWTRESELERILPALRRVGHISVTGRFVERRGNAQFGLICGLEAIAARLDQMLANPPLFESA